MLLSIIQDACDEMGFSRPTVAIASTDNVVKQLVAFAKKEGKELARRFDWQNLKKEATFTTLAASLQTALEDICFELDGATEVFDFQRIVHKTMWNRTQNRMVYGPLSSDEWQMKQAAAANAGVGNMFRIFQNNIYFFPTPSAGDTIYFEYLSKHWCEDAAGVGQPTWEADDDVARIDEEVIRLGVIWRYRQRKGLDYGEDFVTYERAVSNLFGFDGARDDLNLDPCTEPLSLPTIPDGNWETT